MRTSSDDFILNGDVDTGTPSPSIEMQSDDNYAVRELMRIVAVTKKHNLQQKPEVLAGMLDDLSAKLKGGDIISVIKTPVVYGSIAAILGGVIIYKLSKKGKKK